MKRMLKLFSSMENNDILDINLESHIISHAFCIFLFIKRF